MSNEKTLDAVDIENLLRYRYSPPSYAFLSQVRNGTGFFSGVRTADALVMGLWPSRGLHLSGFEIKVYRGDWIKEMKSPEKAESIAQYCDFWWVVAPKEIINVEEVPDNWGLMIPNGKTTKVVKEAKQLKTEPIDKYFLAAILRRAQEEITSEAKIERARKEGREQGKEDAKYHIDRLKEDADKLHKKIIEFQQVSGVDINQWDVGNIAKAVQVVLSGGHLRIQERLGELLKDSQNITKDIEEKLKLIQSV